MAEWLRPRHMNEALQLLAELPAERIKLFLAVLMSWWRSS
jgi:hypothetical protein